MTEFRQLSIRFREIYRTSVKIDNKENLDVLQKRDSKKLKNYIDQVNALITEYNLHVYSINKTKNKNVKFSIYKKIEEIDNDIELYIEALNVEFSFFDEAQESA